MRIFVTNAFTKSSNDGMECFLKISPLNHSCVANAEVMEGEWDVFATRMLEKGDEVLIDYIGLQHGGSTADRQMYTRGSFDFICNCPTCCLEGMDGQISDARRMILSFLKFKMAGLEPAKAFMAEPGAFRPGKG